MAISHVNLGRQTLRLDGFLAEAYGGTNWIISTLKVKIKNLA